MAATAGARNQSIHIIAIGGTGVAPLACLLKQEGYQVRGSDLPLYPPMSDLLEREGLRPLPGFEASHLHPRPDLVIVGNAVPRSNPEVVELGKGITEDDLLFHDEKSPEPSLAYLLSRMRYEDGFPEPIGVFRAVTAPRYDELINQQIAEATSKRGKGDLEELFNSGETWTVS